MDLKIKKGQLLAEANHWVGQVIDARRLEIASKQADAKKQQLVLSFYHFSDNKTSSNVSFHIFARSPTSLQKKIGNVLQANFEGTEELSSKSVLKLALCYVPCCH